MKKFLYHIALWVGGCSLWAACSSDSELPEVPPTPLLINAQTDTRADDEAQKTVVDEKPVFLFWRTSDMANKNYDIAQLSPYCVSWPTGVIDDYEETQWDTGKNYPENNLPVLATGYAPQTLTAGTKTVKNTEGQDEEVPDYATLSIPNPGQTDVLVAEAMQEASSLSPFTQAEALQFIHAQARLVFKAIRHNTMNKRVKKVGVEIGGAYLATELEWKEDGMNSHYVVAAAEATSSCKIGQTDTDSQLSAIDPNKDEASQQYSSIGYIYIKPNQEEVIITVTSSMSNDENFAPAATTSTSTEATLDFNSLLKEENEEDVTLLQANDTYEITLIFQEDKIELIGRKVAWEEGGNILIPVYPLPDASNDAGADAP